MVMTEDLTALLRQARRGDQLALSRAYRGAYERLKQIASRLAKKERLGHTLTPTALVAETYLRKLHGAALDIRNRDHFYSVVALAMRQVLIEHGRRRQATKRVQREELGREIRAELRGQERQKNLGMALARLRKLDGTAYRVIESRFLMGMTMEETARELGRELWRVEEDCAFALKWLGDQLGAEQQVAQPRR